MPTPDARGGPLREPPAGSPFVLPLTAIRETDAALVGGKALGLARLAGAGHRVPSGACLTTRAYEHAVTTDPRFRAALAALADVDLESLEEVRGPAQEIRGAILATALPAAVAEPLAAAAAELQGRPLAVRSSATSEDLAEAAAAGQHDSVLEVAGGDALVAAVKQCWASLWSDRAIVYRSRFGLPSDTKMAVVVQEYVRADVSGIVFTRSPLTGDPGELLVTAGYGAGEAVVSGTAPVDTIAVGRATFRATAELTRAGDRPVLSADQLEVVCRAAVAVEGSFGQAQDIEWALCAGELFLLQARPITAGGERDEPAGMGRLDRLGLRLLLEYFPLPLYPFDRSFVLPLIDTALQLGAELGIDSPRASELLAEDEDGSLRPCARRPRVKPAAALALVKLPFILWRSARTDPFRAVREVRKGIAERSMQLLRLRPAGLGDQELLDVVGECQRMVVEAFESRRTFFAGAWFSLLALPVFLRVLRARGAPRAEDLRAGLLHPTAAMNVALRGLARQAAQDPAIRGPLTTRPAEEAWAELQRLPAAAGFVADVQRLMEEYGCRTEAPIPLPSTRPWLDRPVHVLRVLARFASAPPREQTHADSRRAFVRAYRGVIESARARGGRWLAGILRFLIRRNRALWYERDWVILTYEQAVAPVRGAMREVGRRLARSGVLRSWNEVRFLTLEEVARALNGGGDAAATRALVEKRRAGRRASVRNWSRAIRAVAPAARAGIAVRGTGASPGVAVGPAHVLVSDRDLDGFPAGGVLVCRATGPAWTPLFGLAAAVVTDVGGPLSHAAIVAREYGIPAVIGTGNATAVLGAGRVYTVDGDKGEVLWGAGAAPAP